MKAINLNNPIAVAGLLFFLLLTAFKNVPFTSSMGHLPHKPDAVTEEFINEALVCNRMEIQLALMAARKAETQELKMFVKNLLQFQEDLNSQLQLFAAKKGVQVKDQLSRKCKDNLDKLNRLSGSLFEKRYLNFSERNHSEALQIYKNVLERSDDPELKAFAGTIIPFLETRNASLALLSKSVK